MDMPMAFYLASDFQDLLFVGWNANETWEFALYCVLFVLASMVFEFLLTTNKYLSRRRSLSRSMSMKVEDSSERSSFVEHENPPVYQSCALHFGKTILHVVQVPLGYMLMLIVMAYNGYFLVAIVVGSMFGYFFFGKYLERNGLQNTPSATRRRREDTIPRQSTSFNYGSLKENSPHLDPSRPHEGKGETETLSL